MQRTLTAVEMLERSFDGRIPAERLAYARAIDARRPTPRPPAARIREGSVELKPAAVLAGMTHAARRTILRRQTCHAADLRQAGFSDVQIAKFGDRAVAAAAAEVGRELEHAA